MTDTVPVYLHAEIRLDVDVERVWQVLGDFRHPELGSGFLAGISGEGEGVGAMRTLHIAEEFGGGEVAERQSARDDDGYYYAYELVGDVPFPIDRYYATVQAIPTSSDSTLIVWTNRYCVPSEHAADQRQRSRMFFQLIEANLRRVFDD